MSTRIFKKLKIKNLLFKNKKNKERRIKKSIEFLIGSLDKYVTNNIKNISKTLDQNLIN